MAGSGRRTAYRKHITDETLNALPEPDFKAGERVARVIQSRGGNILEVSGPFVLAYFNDITRTTTTKIASPCL